MSAPRPDVRVVATVRTDPATAFAIWTEQTDLWWRRGPRYRFLRSGNGVLRFEPGVARLHAGDGRSRLAAWTVAEGHGRERVWRLPCQAPHEPLYLSQTRAAPALRGGRDTSHHEHRLMMAAGAPVSLRGAVPGRA